MSFEVMVNNRQPGFICAGASGADSSSEFYECELLLHLQ